MKRLRFCTSPSAILFSVSCLLLPVAPLSAQTNTFPSTGNVGIGTTNPQSNLDLGNGTGGNSLVWGGSGGASHYASIGTAYSSAALSLVYGLKLNTANDQYLYSYSAIGRAGIRIGGVPSDISFFSAASSTQSVNGVFDYSGNTKMIIREGGNVGIGTASPTYKLQVAGPNPQIVVQSTSGTSDLWGMAVDNATQRWGLINNTSGYGEIMSVLRTGNVGIGTTNPAQKLAVNGTIRAKEVVVDTGWSDYVFDENYKLKTLSEVEAYVKAEHHLPGVPSAAQVAKEGIPVGDMQSKLLAKIEELTLHQIEQEKRLNSQSVRLQKLETENAALRANRP